MPKFGKCVASINCLFLGTCSNTCVLNWDLLETVIKGNRTNIMGKKLFEEKN